MTAPFVVLEVACPEPVVHSMRWAATLGRHGTPELLVIRRDDRLLPLHVLADGAGLDVLHALDAQGAGWVANNGGDTGAFVAWLVAELLAEH